MVVRSNLSRCFNDRSLFNWSCSGFLINLCLLDGHFGCVRSVSSLLDALPLLNGFLCRDRLNCSIPSDTVGLSSSVGFRDNFGGSIGLFNRGRSRLGDFRSNRDSLNLWLSDGLCLNWLLNGLLLLRIRSQICFYKGVIMFNQPEQECLRSPLVLHPGL